jgi:hypothetical protein
MVTKVFHNLPTACIEMLPDKCDHRKDIFQPDSNHRQPHLVRWSQSRCNSLMTFDRKL